MISQFHRNVQRLAGRAAGICLAGLVLGVAVAGAEVAAEAVGVGVGAGGPAAGGESPAARAFRRDVQPIVERYCHDCHADGAGKGGVAFDEFATDDALLHPGLWFNVLKNTRAGLMPPRAKPQLSAEERKTLEHWIKRSAFGIDPANPDPGRVTVRRLNRVEYRNTIRDLMGIDFNAEVEFPPDDTGYGFDNIGDVLTMSPMLLEKYLAAAKSIVSQAVPVVARVVPERSVPGIRFQAVKDGEAAGREGGDRGRSGEGGGGRGNRREGPVSLSYYEPASVAAGVQVEQSGTYRVTLELAVRGGFEYDPGRCRVVFKLDGRELLNREFGWYDNKTFRFDFDETWEAGERRMSFELEPLTPVDKKLYAVEMRLVQVVLQGPKEEQHWVAPPRYERFFTGKTPENPAERRAYARELLGNFATRAFRRPVDEPTAERLAGLAEGYSRAPGRTFESGVAHAMVAVLASPRFLFRLEGSEVGSPGETGAGVANVDELSLASRLSYFLWSTAPDDELLRLAGRGELRRNLEGQVRRMMADARSEQLIQNFTGQWLQTRDVEGISINSRAVLARDSGQERQMRQQQEEFRARLAQRPVTNASPDGVAVAGVNAGVNGVVNGDRPAGAGPSPTPGLALASTNSAGSTNVAGQRRGFGNRRNFQPRIELDRDLREAMRRETEMFVSNIVREDRPVTELIDSDHTFLNEKLAGLYGLTNLNVKGAEMRRVTLPPGSPRGGVLTHGSALVVTSNPDRTSPVKRGLFILENFLGTPAPPPPANIPALEAVEKDFKDRPPTMREAMQAHREKPLCASCHARMDPIGLAFENFNAMGMWRETERNQPIDTAGELVTGESFRTVGELKRILVEGHRVDFYRCLTEKLLTYALGRGTEYYDVETIDQIVQRLERDEGRFSALLMGVVESAPFQRMRTQATATAFDARETPSEEPAIQTRVASNQNTP